MVSVEVEGTEAGSEREQSLVCFVNFSLLNQANSMFPKPVRLLNHCRELSHLTTRSDDATQAGHNSVFVFLIRGSSSVCPERGMQA